MTENAAADKPVERRTLQRDWLGHTIYAVGVVVAVCVGLGVPLLYWGDGVNANLAILMDHDKTNTAAIATAVSQSINVGADIAVLKDEMRDIRDTLKDGRKK